MTKKYIPVLLMISLWMFSCAGGDDAASTTTVKYTVSCSDCTVMYTSDSSGTYSTLYHQTAGWTHSFEAKPGQPLMFYAYNTSGSPEFLSASLYHNGVLHETDESYCPVSGYVFIMDTIP